MTFMTYMTYKVAFCLHVNMGVKRNVGTAVMQPVIINFFKNEKSGLRFSFVSFILHLCIHLINKFQRQQIVIPLK